MVSYAEPLNVYIFLMSILMITLFSSLYKKKIFIMAGITYALLALIIIKYMTQVGVSINESSIHILIISTIITLILGIKIHINKYLIRLLIYSIKS